MRIPFFRQISWYLVVAMFIIGIVPRLEGAMVPSSFIASSPLERAADIGRIQNALETKIVKERLERLGFTTEEIGAKLDRLSDQQIHQLALQIDDLKVGKDAGGVIVALIIIALIVVAVLYFSGRKVIVTK